MHVGIIMDGNRKYADKKKLFPRFKGHLQGKKNLEKFLLDWTKSKEPKYLTLYTFSLYNLKRNIIEKKFIFHLLEKGFKELLDTKEIFENKIKVSFVGKKEKCPIKLRKLMEKIEKQTEKHNNKFLNFCICYDGHEEIANAFNEMIGKIKKTDEKTIKKYLYTKNLPPADLIIRTGGEKRLSGFMLWDVSYAEIVFKEETWPEYSYKIFKQDLKEFRKRKRRFGR